MSTLRQVTLDFYILKLWTCWLKHLVSSFLEELTLMHKHTKKNWKLTIRKCQNTYYKEEWDDQDEPHPEVTVTVSIISAGSKVKLVPPWVITTYHIVKKIEAIA